VEVLTAERIVVWIQSGCASTVQNRDISSCCCIKQSKVRTTKVAGGKILQDGNIAAELPRTLLTLTRHFIGTCG
jgi:hypothetical protein